MSLRNLIPAKTASARANALNAFKRWVASEEVPFEHLVLSIAQISNASVFESTMDKFGMYLTFDEGLRNALAA
ncbi:hypothetical protein H257_14790 [Aphanomyces astaci]|uniref:Uncharacterized protein n=1 Tax=Aphanomyces astaci TaxID=112090 RepID=W4FRX4_APHAT|nr:hypothetical protein H257_14790 [Aphanomyces astaci]ETV69554.1 hypothetical protein H257_14790 [Aphanomyces astaci]|eukprot:XP_009840978.1 hypothetical protein H257_14790 [Aphanomyces astaci]